MTLTVGLSEMGRYSFAIYFHCHVAEDRHASRDQNLREFFSARRRSLCSVFLLLQVFGNFIVFKLSMISKKKDHL